MGDAVRAICHLIGVTDPVAVSVATGGIVASIVWLVGYLVVLGAIHGFIAIISAR